MEATPFLIAIPETQVLALSARLQHTRWPDHYDGSPWALGADPAYVRELAHYWATGYDWRIAEQRLNREPQFIAKVGGLNIHYVHRRGVGPRPYPLVITHGWPGSFIEFMELLPHLCDPASVGADPADAFDVVVPSLPGFGFSEHPVKPGTSAFATADVWAELMHGLGYERFGAQGGDLGAAVSISLALRHPQHVDGIHLNYLPGSYEPPLSADDPPVTPREQTFLDARAMWTALEGGYAHVHSTKPQTLATSLNDSPAGLAAWIVEKFRAWSDCNGDIESVFSKDELLTNLSLYWYTQTIASSMRFYWEMRLKPLRFAHGERVQPPLGFARFPKEISRPPQSWIERVFDLKQWADMPRGGHFAAMEQPALLAGEIRRFFRPLRR
ncbi:epoxide hydrolase family protein [Paraburkholderia saeva]|uniref:Soluble epoxide hydrolase n=1 Tax=Paraburkholderia saeva TaxID=2777537 RepID=A0A9N8S159_9BURK|nr:epoxide hydrolase family protein [Paraburkholderia saeva]CAG4889080.1 Soluble epoxide hydrolase [Paraburkholderia saeva]CAG4894250.1 Soluble epoxide hydrolase [Paraburkholderia saeva]CAG4917110.1 Soluble epoxide hydrolase [Paraburkholderia saeva]